MIFLDVTNRSLEIDLAGAVSTNELPFITHYVDLDSSFAVSDIESNNGVSNGTTAVTMVAAPGASTFRQIKTISIYNADTVNATVTVQYNDNATLRTIVKIILEPDWTLQYEEESGWRVTDENGILQSGATIVDISGTPVNNQLAIWTDADTLEGDSNLTWDGSSLAVTGDLDFSGQTVNVSLNNAVDALNFDSNTLSIDALNNRVGIGNIAPGSNLEVSQGTTSSIVEISTWSTNDAEKSRVIFQKSSNATVNTLAATAADEDIGVIRGRGVDTSSNSRVATEILFEGDAAPDADTVPGRISFWTSDAVSLKERMKIDDDGNLGIGISIPLAKTHVDQASTTAAIPVLILDQADISEEMIEFISTIGTGNAIEAIGAKTLTTTHFIKVTLPGSLTRYIPVGTIA